MKAPRLLAELLRLQGGITGCGQVSWALLGRRDVCEVTKRTFWLEGS